MWFVSNQTWHWPHCLPLYLQLPLIPGVNPTLTPDINQHPNSFLRQYLGYTVHHHLQYKPKTGIHGWQVSQQVWCDTPQCGRDDRPRCGMVTDLFKKPAEQKEWGTGVQWDTVASRPVDFTHTAAAADTPCLFQQQKPAGEPACSLLSLCSLSSEQHSRVSDDVLHGSASSNNMFMLGAKQIIFFSLQKPLSTPGLVCNEFLNFPQMFFFV